MARILGILLAALVLTACTREPSPYKKAFMDACLKGQKEACDVLSAAAIGDATRYNAAMTNWTNATNNTAQWTVDQQNTRSYSGGYRYNYPRY